MHVQHLTCFCMVRMKTSSHSSPHSASPAHTSQSLDYHTTLRLFNQSVRQQNKREAAATRHSCTHLSFCKHVTRP